MSERKGSKQRETFPALFRSHAFDPEVTAGKKFREKQLFTVMASLFCRAEKHEATHTLADLKADPDIARWIQRSPRLRRRKVCADCLSLIAESFRHTARCPHTAYKTFCHLCPTPCYAPREREAMIPVMRQAGPRLLLHHPILALRFMKDLLAAKRLLKQYETKPVRKTEEDS